MSKPSLVPDLNIRINGSDLPEAAQLDIKSVTVHEDLDAASMFAIDLYNWDQNTLGFTWSDNALFAPGNEVEIWLGYVDALAKVMVGETTSLEPAFQADEVPQVTVRGYDRRHRLLRGRRTRSFTKMKDSAIASKIAGDAGLQARVKDSKVTLDYVLQHNQTDMAFLQDRARRIGYEVFVQEKILYFQPRQNATKEAVTLSLSRDVIAFFPRLTTMSQVGEVAVHGWDVKAKKAILSKAAAGSESTTMGGKSSGPKTANKAFGRSSEVRVTWPVSTKAEADGMAVGQFNEMALGYISGELTCAGRADLHAGVVVKVEEAGKNFSGLYYVTAVTHSVGPTHGYQTRLQVRRNAT